ncbi:MAG: TIM barrel protein [Pseudomonadales bacterium]|nr:TIM barrel protein [Pseudomonadales bacterium]
MSEPLWALAAGCVPDALPWDIPRIADAGGFRSSGMWIDPETTWDNRALSKTKAALSETGIQLVDVEALWLAGGEKASDTHKLAVDAGLELGARNVLVVSVHEDYEASVAQFRDICDRAGDGNIRINLEFGEFTNIRSLSAARNFVAAVDHPKAGILIDLMHLNRAGDSVPMLQSDEFSYVQACDFLQSSAFMAGQDYIDAAVDHRYCLGEGEAKRSAIEAVCVANMDVSLEIRSKDLRDRFPDPMERSKQIFQRCDRGAYS